MKVLIACEESQVVCKAFRERGHEAYSCDIQECSGGHPEWHIIEDVTRVLSGGYWDTQLGIRVYIESWDLMIAHPPCTYLSRVAIQHNKKPGRLQQREDAIKFFLRLKKADIPKIAIENPHPQKYVTERIGYWNQKIHPFYFGDPHLKGTCLWLKGLKKLSGLLHVAREIKKYKPEPLGYNGRGNPYYWCGMHITEEDEVKRSRNRSKTFPGIAKAMAEQWG